MADPDARAPVALAEFVAQHGQRLMRTAVLMTGNTEAGQDLCQETLARLVTAWPGLRSPAAAPAYALKVMSRVYHRSQRRRWRLEIPTGFLPEHPVAGPDAETALDVRAALARLPPRQRATLILRHYAGLSIEETAAAMACSEGTVKSQSARGLAALAELIDRPRPTRSIT